MKVIDHGIDNAVINQNSETEFITDLKETDKWQCLKCGKCCEKMKCRFLKDNRCLDYEKRPIVCKLFPLSLFVRDNKIFFIKSLSCPGWNKGERVDFSYFVSLMEEFYNEFKKNPEILEGLKEFFNE